MSRGKWSSSLTRWRYLPHHPQVFLFPRQEPRYVCVKMFGGGMGDQIKRWHSTKKLPFNLSQSKMSTPFQKENVCHWRIIFVNVKRASPILNSRYCEQLEPEDYHLLEDMEVSNISSFVSKSPPSTVSTATESSWSRSKARQSEGESFDVDPNCVKTKDKGRDVEICRWRWFQTLSRQQQQLSALICRCSTDNCNPSSHLASSPVLAILTLATLLSQT